MVVVTLLSLIVLALMAVFNTTQAAFRASVTQSDVLEGGRAAMDVIAGDLRQMSPSLGQTNNAANFFEGAVNFYAAVPSGYQSLVQSLIGSANNRVNVLESFFILSRQNQTWTGVGYAVNTTATDSINPLYRFSMSTNVASGSPWLLFYYFTNAVANNNFTNMSRLMNGVVDLRVRSFTPGGAWMQNSNNQIVPAANNVRCLPFGSGSGFGETGFQMFSNALPASVEIQMGVLEDRTLQRAESFPSVSSQSNYLAGQAATVHVFRQRVSIQNVDPSAYQ